MSAALAVAAGCRSWRGRRTAECVEAKFGSRLLRSRKGGDAAAAAGVPPVPRPKPQLRLQ